MSLVTNEEITAAARRIDGLVVRTPLLECERLSSEFGCRVLIKPENLQHTGSFKPRGALNTLLSWRESGQLPDRVVSFSAGNHAAVAYAGRKLGVRAVVSMPTNALPSKVDNVHRYGGEIVPTDDLMGTCAELADRYGCPKLYPFDMPEIIAGQGTVGAEICADEPEPDIVLVPVGGGGLISGIATAVKSAAPRARVIGVESEASDAMGSAWRAGEVVRLAGSAQTIADGLAAPFAGEHTLAQAKAHVDDMVTVPERSIAEAWPELISATKLVLEPSAVVGLAALRTGAVAVRPDVVVVLAASGGNADLSALPG